MMTKRTVVLLVVVVCGVLGCNRNETFTERLNGAPLMLGAFDSYTKEKAVRSALGPLPVEILEESRLANGDARPPYTIVTLRIEPYRHLGSVGALHLTFFNDRLMTAFFYSRDVRTYTTSLKARRIDVRADPKGVQIGMVHVWMARDHRGQDYVGWADVRLEEQSRRWISRYS